jgi:hypothetical protein
MTDDEEKRPEKDKPDLSDWEPFHDNVGVTHWVPPQEMPEL